MPITRVSRYLSSIERRECKTLTIQRAAREHMLETRRYIQPQDAKITIKPLPPVVDFAAWSKREALYKEDLQRQVMRHWESTVVQMKQQLQQQEALRLSQLHQQALLARQAEQQALQQKEAAQQALLAQQAEQQALLQRQAEQQALQQKEAAQQALLAHQADRQAWLNRQAEQHASTDKKEDQQASLAQQADRQAWLNRQAEQHASTDNNADHQALPRQKEAQEQIEQGARQRKEGEAKQIRQHRKSQVVRPSPYARATRRHAPGSPSTSPRLAPRSGGPIPSTLSLQKLVTKAEKQKDTKQASPAQQADRQAWLKVQAEQHASTDSKVEQQTERRAWLNSQAEQHASTDKTEDQQASLARQEDRQAWLKGQAEQHASTDNKVEQQTERRAWLNRQEEQHASTDKTEDQQASRDQQADRQAWLNRQAEQHASTNKKEDHQALPARHKEAQQRMEQGALQRKEGEAMQIRQHRKSQVARPSPYARATRRHAPGSPSTSPRLAPRSGAPIPSTLILQGPPMPPMNQAAKPTTNATPSSAQGHKPV
ncbi:hypothetical protein DFQ27_009692, partial [Actinomortierella ambigua]